MIYIYQIGRLESRMQPLEFLIEDKALNFELSSVALKNHFKNNVKLILIYPVSLPFNKNLIDSKSNLEDSFKSKINKILENKKAYFENPYEFFKLHPHTSYADDFALIHSLGEYEGEVFEGKFDDIVLEILIDLIERHLNCPITELYVDISSGHNIYVSAMLEAVRHFSIFHKLSTWDTNNFSIKLTFSDPIIGSSKQKFEIHRDYELKYKAFFSSPITRNDLACFNLSRKIAEENRELKRKIHNMLEKFAFCYSALKNNTPLFLYHYDFDREEDIKSLVLEIIEKLKVELFKDWKSSPSVDKNEYLKVLFSLSFYIGIIRILLKHQIYAKYEAEIDEIKEKFAQIYKYFGLDLNREILGHEISNLKRKDKNDGTTLIERASENWQSLSDFIYGEGEFQNRNFIAHAGFERTVTEIKKHDNKLHVKYKADSINKIKRTLLEAL